MKAPRYHVGQVRIEPLIASHPNPYAAGRARIEVLGLWRNQRAIPRGFRVVGRLPGAPPEAIRPTDVDWRGSAIGAAVDADPKREPEPAPIPSVRADAAPIREQGGMFDAPVED